MCHGLGVFQARTALEEGLPLMGSPSSLRRRPRPLKEQIKGEKARVLFGFVVVICCEKFKDFLVYWLMIEEPRRDGWKVGKREGKKNEGL